MATWPTSKPDSTKFDSDNDRISTSRPELKTMSDAVNDIVDYVDPTGITDGQVLAYDSASQKLLPQTIITTDTDTHVDVSDGLTTVTNVDTLSFVNSYFDVNDLGSNNAQVTLNSTYEMDITETACTSGGSYTLNITAETFISPGVVNTYYTQNGGSTGWTVDIQINGSTVHTTSGTSIFVIVKSHRVSGARISGANIERCILHHIYEVDGSNNLTETVKMGTFYS